MGNVLKRYGVFLLSVVIIGTGITIITKTGLGTTAVTSLPFVVSRIWKVSLETMTMWFNLLWVVLQAVLLRGRFEKRQWLQLTVGPLLGGAIDLSAVVLSFIQPQLYVTQVLYLVAGSAVLAFGIYLQLEARAIYNPAEGFVNALSEVMRKPFGTVKTAFDVTMVVSALVLSWLVMGDITGIREGTLISALLIGPLTTAYRNVFAKQRETVSNFTR